MARQDRDTAPGALDHHVPLKVTREIPLWGVLTVIAALGAQAVALYYGQQRLVEKMGEVSAEVRALAASSRQADADRVATRMQIDELARRVAELERRARP